MYCVRQRSVSPPSQQYTNLPYRSHNQLPKQVMVARQDSAEDVRAVYPRENRCLTQYDQNAYHSAVFQQPQIPQKVQPQYQKVPQNVYVVRNDSFEDLQTVYPREERGLHQYDQNNYHSAVFEQPKMPQKVKPVPQKVLVPRKDSAEELHTGFTREMKALKQNEQNTYHSAVFEQQQKPQKAQNQQRTQPQPQIQPQTQTRRVQKENQQQQPQQQQQQQQQQQLNKQLSEENTKLKNEVMRLDYHRNYLQKSYDQLKQMYDADQQKIFGLNQYCQQYVSYYERNVEALQHHIQKQNENIVRLEEQLTSYLDPVHLQTKVLDLEQEVYGLRQELDKRNLQNSQLGHQMELMRIDNSKVQIEKEILKSEQEKLLKLSEELLREAEAIRSPMSNNPSYELLLRWRNMKLKQYTYESGGSMNIANLYKIYTSSAYKKLNRMAMQQAGMQILKLKFNSLNDQ